MRYERKFRLQVAHFNNSKAYELYEQALHLYDTWDEAAYRTALTSLLECLSLIHGHNLEVLVEAVGMIPSKSDTWVGVGMVVDDAELLEMVMSWDNANLSVLPEFAGKRATTEEIADTLADKIFRKWSNLQGVRVSVWETPDICARSIRGTM